MKTQRPLEGDELHKAERDIQATLGDHPLDFRSMQVVASIYRAAAAVRRRAERDLLAEAGLSWGGFTILFVLWVWGPMETARLAAECDLAKGTLTGMLTTLEKQGLVQRDRMVSDRRRVMVGLTDEGKSRSEKTGPLFNDFERQVTDHLDDGEKDELSALLRVVITNADNTTTPEGVL
ncbi:MAG: winged helix-turn-helix transcriptional regulator [Actinomycetia bacterium]|nr:winged helix-turn-helix transcriptional regulator [Actinomycetes bacterium]